MDLKSAINFDMSKCKYKDYTDPEDSARDYNKNVVDRIFDIGPLSSKNCAPTRELDGYKNTLCPIDQNITRAGVSANARKAPPPSREYLQMKHAQEYETLMENPTSTSMSLSQLKVTQQDETRKMADQMQAAHSDKYKNLKYMSPDMLNASSGRQPFQSVLPIASPTVSNDVYQQTSYNYNHAKVGSRQLKMDLENRQRKILAKKDTNGIQSYNTSSFGTNLDDAYAAF
jgi:hypothetical protein